MFKAVKSTVQCYVAIMNHQSSRGASRMLQRTISSSFYDLHYERVYYRIGPLPAAIDRLHTSIESRWLEQRPRRTCEFGFGSGEHLRYVKERPSEIYVGVDIKPNGDSEAVRNFRKSDANVQVIGCDASDTGLRTSSFDRVSATCLLHHVPDPTSVLLEMRRICVPGGEISFVLPTDPGLLNRLVKTMVTFPLLRKSGIENPRLLYAVEHINHVSGILELTKLVFADDRLSIRYKPFPLPTWNWNLWISVHVVRSNSDGAVLGVWGEQPERDFTKPHHGST